MSQTSEATETADIPELVDDSSRGLSSAGQGWNGFAFETRLRTEQDCAFVNLYVLSHVITTSSLGFLTHIDLHRDPPSSF